jgi:molecular chaperone DnaK
MQPGKALDELGLSAGATPQEVEQAFAARCADLEGRIEKAPTSMLKEKLGAALAKVHEAHAELSAAGAGSEPKPRPRSKPVQVKRRDRPPTVSHLGIDLGTTFSLVAQVNQHNSAALFPDFHDANAFRTPSVVHVGPDGALVGQTVEDLLEDEPTLPVARFTKLRMGEEEELFRDEGGRSFYPESVSALIMRKLVRDALAFGAEEPRSLVVAVPAQFNDTQRRATRDAALLAGLPTPTLVEEPVAAATYYGNRAEAEQTIFVFDLGGGTFDATVLQASSEGLYALATEGSNEVGGRVFDEAIMEQVAAAFMKEHNLDPLQDPAARVLLRRFAEQTKLRLSKPGQTKVKKTLLLCGRTADVLVTKKKLAARFSELIDETLKVCSRCLRASGLDWSYMDRVLLTGGSSLIPLVRTKLQAASGKPEQEVFLNQPHQAVAYGAAMVAAQETGEGAADAPKLMQQIASHDLGLRVRGRDGEPCVKTLIERNTPLPARHTKVFYTARADQTRVILELVQCRADSERSLGYFAFGPIRAGQAQYPIEVTVSYTAEGLVRVQARDPRTGQEVSRVMEDSEDGLAPRLSCQRELLQGMRVNE